jgi:molybdopterin synthase catalytic subunit
MAINSMKDICQNIRSQWEVTRVVIQHKLEDCPIGEVSVLIAVSSPHRKESLKAVEWAIDELKRTVPIWKKENYGTGDSIWKANVDINPNAGVVGL